MPPFWIGQLHQTNERYRLIIEGSTDHALITVDRKGGVTSWNPGAERLLGYTESEIMGKDYRDLLHSRRYSERTSRSAKSDKSSGMDWIEQEGWHVRKDGTRFLSETVTARLGEGDATNMESCCTM